MNMSPRFLLLAILALFAACSVAPSFSDDDEETTAPTSSVATPTPSPTPTPVPTPTPTARIGLCTPTATAPDALTEDCSTYKDDDGDGDRSCEDSDCASDPACGETGTADETSAQHCTDGVDNDDNSYTDCDDRQCGYQPGLFGYCPLEEATNDMCADGNDNDGNGWADCKDFGCTQNPFVTACFNVEASEDTCTDGIDNNRSGDTDCRDPGCALAVCCGGAGFAEDDPATCSDGVDNDGDGDTDCLDSDCAGPTNCPLVLNEFLADPPGDQVDGDSNCDGGRNSAEDEFVEFYNQGVDPLDLSDAVFADSSQDRYTLPPNTILPAGGTLVIFGGGTPTFDGSAITIGPHCVDLSAANVIILTGSNIGLNNSNDQLTLTTSGGSVLARVGYGAADRDQSRVLDPEITGSSFVDHSTVTNSIGAFSPGTRADGTAF